MSLFFISRGSFRHLWYLSKFNPLFMITFFSGVIAINGMLLIIAAAVLMIQQQNHREWAYRDCLLSLLVRGKRSKVVQSVVMVAGTLATNLQLMARVVQGPCAPGTSSLSSVVCVLCFFCLLCVLCVFSLLCHLSLLCLPCFLCVFCVSSLSSVSSLFSVSLLSSVFSVSCASCVSVSSDFFYSLHHQAPAVGTTRSATRSRSLRPLR